MFIKRVKKESLAIILVMTLLFQVAGMRIFAESSASDFGNDAGSAYAMQVGSQIAGEINYAGDVDFFKFTPTFSGTYVIGTTGTTDTYGYLLDSNQNQLSYNDDSNGTTNFSITYNLNAYQQYFVKVRHYSSSGTGTYSFMIKDANNDFSNAQSMQVGNSISSAIEYAGDADYYSFTPTATGTYSFASTGNTDTYGYLYDSNKNQLIYNDDSNGTTNFNITYQLRANNTYYIKVRHYSSTATGAYNINAALIIRKVYGASTDIEAAKSIWGTAGYQFIQTDAPGYVLPSFNSTDIILGGTGASGGVPDVNLNGAVRLAGATRDLTAQAIANFASPINVYGAAADIDNAKSLLGSAGYNYIYSDAPGFTLPVFSTNDIVVGGSGSTGGISDSVNLNGALRLAGADREGTADAIRNYSVSKKVYGALADINQAQSILGNEGYVFIDSSTAGFSLPIFCSNNIVVGGTGATGGIGDVPLNGAIRLAGVNRDLTAQAIANYLSPINVYGDTIDVNNAKNILGTIGYNYIYSDVPGFTMPSFTSNDIVVGGPGATGGIPGTVNLNGALRLYGTDSTGTMDAIRSYSVSKKVYGTSTDLSTAQSILGSSGYVYIRSDVSGFRLPVFCSNNIIVGGTGAAGGIGNVDLKGAVRLAGANRDLTAQAIVNYVRPIKVYGAATDIENAKSILGPTGYTYIYTDIAGFQLPMLTSNDVVVGGPGAIGGVPDSVNLNGANRLYGADRTATAKAISNYSVSQKVYGNGVDLDLARSIMGDTGYVYIRSDLAGFQLPIFCSNDIIVGGTGAAGGIGDVNLNGATRLCGADRDATASAIRDYYNAHNPTPAPDPVIGTGDTLRQNVVTFAEKFIGKIPYYCDGSITTQILDLNNLPPYMDCADFTSSVYLTVLKINIGPNTYTQIGRGTAVAKSQSSMKPGDLILFDWDKNGTPDHVGMYIGNGQFIHEHGSSSNYGTSAQGNVAINNLSDYSSYYWNHIISVRRIIQDDGTLINN